MASSKRRMIIAINPCLKNEEIYQINNIILQIKEVERGGQTNFNFSRKKETIKIKAEITE